MRLSGTKATAIHQYRGLGNQLWDLAGNRPSLDLRFADDKSLVDATTGTNLIDFTRASSGTYVGSDGLIKTATTNEARFDHDPTTGESLGLLVEEQRANLVTDSSLTTVGVTYSASISSTTETNPEGINFCRRLLSDAGSGGPNGHRIRVAANSPNNITVSAFVKKDTHRYVYIGFGGGSNSFTALFDIDPTVTGDRLLGQGGQGTYTNIDAGYQNFPNGWVRIWAAGTTTGTEGTTIGLSPDDSTYAIANWVAAGTEAIFIHGVQYEDNATFPTSYIPTTDSAFTRADDVASITGTNFSSWYRQDEGTVFYDGQVLGSDPTVVKTLLGLTDGTTDNVIYMLIPTGQNQRFRMVNGGDLQTLQNAIPTADVYSPAKVAYAFKLDDTTSAGNGTVLETDTSCTVPTVDRFIFGSVGTGAAEVAARYKRLTFWPARLPDSTLQGITQQ